MSDDIPQPPASLTGGCMCGAVRTYQTLDKAFANRAAAAMVPSTAKGGWMA